MFAPPSFNRLSVAALLVALLSLIVAMATALDGVVHRTPNRATRLADGQVGLDIALSAAESCIAIASVTPGAPDGFAAPSDSLPITVRLQRPAGVACAQVITPLRGRALLGIGREVRRLQLVVVEPEGRVTRSARIPIKG